MRRPKRIFIVDDDNDILFTFKIGLESYGYEVVVHVDPTLALSNFQPHFYDLLLVDIRMPRMNGFEFSQKIRRIDKRTKICFITAFEPYYEALVEDYEYLDFKCFIKKPIKIDMLVQRIKKELLPK